MTDGTTLCPHCATRFRIGEVQLNAHGGMVRCGHCRQAFDARTNYQPDLPNPQLDLPIEPVHQAKTVDSQQVDGQQMPPEAEAQVAAETAQDEMIPTEAEVIVEPEIAEDETCAPADESPSDTETQTETGTGTETDDTEEAPAESDESQAEAVAPDAEQPDAEQPDAEQPDAEQPDAEQPDTEQPDTEQPVPESDDHAADNTSPADVPAEDNSLDFSQPVAAPETQPPAEAAHTEVDALLSTTSMDAAAHPSRAALHADNDILLTGYQPQYDDYADETPPVKRRVWPWMTGIVILLLALLAQSAYFFRVSIAAHAPGLKPALLAYCDMLGCDVPLPRDAELISIESSSLDADAVHANQVNLDVLLRNRSGYTMAYPALSLTLNDMQDKPIANRVFLPADYLPANEKEAAGLAANHELPILLRMDSGDLRPIGYRVELFYPQ